MARYLVGLSPDITTKSSRTRVRFLRRLARNVRDALRDAGVEGSIDDRWSRLLVETTGQGISERLASVFGVHSVAEVEAEIDADVDAIVRTGERLFAARVQGRTFAVRTRRAGPVPFRSREIDVKLGAALNAHGSVDLSNPDVTVTVEIRDGDAFLFAGRTPGAGGLPLGVQGRAVALLSGGFDSPVASWMMLRRGIALDYVFCNLGGDAYERSVVAVAKVLADSWSYGDRPRLHVVDFAAPVKAMESAVPRRFWQVVLKRLMYRAAIAVAEETRGQAIVTGESVGQVSSQTLSNLRAIEEVSPLPLLRPLLGMDKNEIIARAGTVGTAVLSTYIREYCALDAGRPVTDATAEVARGHEARVDLTVLDHAVRQRKKLDLRSLDGAELVAPYLFAAEVDAAAVVIDCRTPAQFSDWHYAGAERWDPGDLAAGFRKLDKTRPYLLYCNYGVQSAHVAELMQRAGYEAYSFRGGVAALRRYSGGSEGVTALR